MKVPETRLLLRWLAFAGLLLLLTIVFATQLYLAGYVRPWSSAFAQEAIYWLSWAALAPMIFWMCRRLWRGEQDAYAWTRYAFALSLGAIVASILQPVIADVAR